MELTGDSNTVKSVLVSAGDSVIATSELVIVIKPLDRGDAEIITVDKLTDTCEGVMNISIELLAGTVDEAITKGDDINVASISDDNVGIKSDVSIPLPISEESITVELLGMNTEVVSGN